MLKLNSFNLVYIILDFVLFVLSHTIQNLSFVFWVVPDTDNKLIASFNK